MAFTPPPAVPQRGDRTTFSDRVDAFLTWMAGLIDQLNQFLGDLTAISVGGAYAPMMLSDLSTTADGDPGTGKVRFNTTSQASATALYVDNSSAGGQDITAMIASWALPTGAFKGALRLVKQGDPSKWLVFRVSSVISNTGYFTLGVVPVQGSATSPFVTGDGIILQFTPASDTGVGAGPMIRVQDQKGATTNAGDSAANTFQTRVLNTQVRNTLTGASLSANQVTLPAGVYKVTGSAPAVNTTSHQAYLWSVTGSTILLHGTSEANSPSSTAVTLQSRSFIVGEITLAGTTAVQLRHFTGVAVTGFGLGLAAGNNVSGALAVYAEILFEKVG